MRKIKHLAAVMLFMLVSVCAFAAGTPVKQKITKIPKFNYAYTVRCGVVSTPYGYTGAIWINQGTQYSFNDRVVASQDYTATCHFVDAYNNPVSYSVTIHSGDDFGQVNTYMGPFATTPQPTSITGSSAFYGGYPVDIDQYLHDL